MEHLPMGGGCVAYGVTVRATFPLGKTTEAAGCIESAPYPGMDRPGHPERGVPP